MTFTPDYLLIGHMTADLFPEGRILGGTVSYAAQTADAFGLKVGILTSAQADEPLMPQLAKYAVIESVEAESTSTFENIYNGNERIQYVRGVAEKLTAAHIPEAWKASKLVHLAPLTDEVDPQIAHTFPDATVLLTLQGWLRRWDADGRVQFKRWFDADVLKSIDIVVFSEDDIADAPDLEALFAANTEHLLVTRAHNGGTYYHRGVPRHYDTPQVDVVNATGAGDVFAATLLACLDRFGGDVYRAVQVAARLGALSVTRYGLEGAPTPEEAEAAVSAVL